MLIIIMSNNFTKIESFLSKFPKCYIVILIKFDSFFSCIVYFLILLIVSVNYSLHGLSHFYQWTSILYFDFVVIYIFTISEQEF